MKVGDKVKLIDKQTAIWHSAGSYNRTANDIGWIEKISHIHERGYLKFGGTIWYNPNCFKNVTNQWKGGDRSASKISEGN